MIRACSFILLLLPAVAYTQVYRNAVYAELGGAGLAYSVGYERHFGAQRAFVARAGVSAVWLVEANTREQLRLQALPVGFSWLYGRRAHRLELGLGLTAAFAQSNLDTREGSLDTYSFLAAVATVGYRYQPLSSRWFARVALTPLYGGARFDPLSTGGFMPWLSLGGGYRFGS